MSDISGQEYSTEITQEFETTYTKEKDALRRAVDKIFRKGMKERYDLAIQECKSVNGKKILDLGCDTGYLSIELAKRGAQVVGINSSLKAIGATRQIAERERLPNRCALIQDDFAKHLFNEKFDISLALGFFDHAKDPAFYLKKIKALTTEKCIMSFPSKLAFQVPLRMIWLRSRNLPVYFYTKSELKGILSQQFPHFKIKNISAGYFCVASVKDKTKQLG